MAASSCRATFGHATASAVHRPSRRRSPPSFATTSSRATATATASSIRSCASGSPVRHIDMEDKARVRPAGHFATTRWSLVLAAGQNGQRSRQALESLCELYWLPVYSFIRRQGYQADDALDMAQGFFARMIEKDDFREADPHRGRFRSFLMASVQHFLSNERDRARALKRGGPKPAISLDVQTAEGRYQIEPRDELTPERHIDFQWASVLLQRVLGRLHEEHETAG